jgi:hypothetical protein
VHAGPKDEFVVVVVVVVVVTVTVMQWQDTKLHARARCCLVEVAGYQTARACKIVMYGIKKCSIVMYAPKSVP